MLNEHAITYQERISVADLDYLVKKSNRLGKNGRDVVRVFQQEDAEGAHVYFEVTGLSKEYLNDRSKERPREVSSKV